MFFLVSVMSMYGFVVLFVVGVAMASASIPKCWYCLPEPICEPCVCRVQAKKIDIAENGVFAPWFNSVFDKVISTKCPAPTFKKGYYYLPNFAKCTCQEDKVPIRKCISEITKLQDDLPKKVLSHLYTLFLSSYNPKREVNGTTKLGATVIKLENILKDFAILFSLK